MKWLRLFPIILFVIIAIVFFRGLLIDPKKIPSALIGQPIPHFALPTLTSTHPVSSDTLKGKTYVLNVFTSSCEACQAEHALLLKIAREKQVAVYGLSYKDRVKVIKQFLDELENPYQSVFIDEIGSTALNLGVYTIPETFLVDAEGIVRYRWTGPLTQAIWDKEFLPQIIPQKRTTHG